MLLVPELAECLNFFSGLDGSASAPAGDVDADGEPDWIEGLRGHDPDLSATGGEKYLENGGYFGLYSGRTGRVLLSVEGARQRDEWGRRVGAAGDVNGDGIDDVFVTSRCGLWVLYGRRAGFWW